MSHLTQICLKRIEMKKKKKYPLSLDMCKVRVAKRNLTYPMSLPGSQGGSMTCFIFMAIGPKKKKLWALEEHIHTHRQTLSPFIIRILVM